MLVTRLVTWRNCSYVRSSLLQSAIPKTRLKNGNQGAIRRVHFPAKIVKLSMSRKKNEKSRQCSMREGSLLGEIFKRVVFSFFP